jgi:hypothetical protein
MANNNPNSGLGQGDTSRSSGNFSNDSDAGGRRVRIRPKPQATSQIYGDGGILQPLKQTNGLVFPYQPTIQYTQDTTYTSIDLVHTNQELYAFNRSNAVKLQIQGQFTTQSQEEGVYGLACIHFLRTVTKMSFGDTDRNAGTPPPVLLLDAYGQFMFNQLPVIVNSFSVGLPADVDYVPVDLSQTSISGTLANGKAASNASLISKTASQTTWAIMANASRMASTYFKTNLISQSGYVWLPAVYTIDVSVTVQNTPSRLRQFNLETFRTGELMKGGKWI